MVAVSRLIFLLLASRFHRHRGEKKENPRTVVPQPVHVVVRASADGDLVAGSRVCSADYLSILTGGIARFPRTLKCVAVPRTLLGREGAYCTCFQSSIYKGGRELPMRYATTWAHAHRIGTLCSVDAPTVLLSINAPDSQRILFPCFFGDLVQQN
jgi:hypothetical protein